ncbi:exopolysaccharide biosynthesis protein [Maribius pontilimi]|uniref:Exopolysaccharide biosynthesis protein n=1 Tax=Palleronia pontilimi TaxID=1964209 RepID=A0A934MDA2_9RHOB|nr:exopolysaccharide biosynthesis protein [Palleronia pontilimi]MBJ3763683.1 exopolysaccharide biosynthesis protein [Palleronia pontilimi]
MTGSPQPEQSEQPDAGGFAALIRDLDSRRADGETVTLGDALDAAGARVHGVAILLMALPEALPLPIPSFGAVLGVPLILVSLHLAFYGERGDLPPRARRVRLPDRLIDLLARRVAGPLERAERLTGDRLPALANLERLVGLVSIMLSFLLFLPVPFLNMAPALALVCLSWGLIQRDGFVVGLGLAVSVGIFVTVFALGDLLAGMLATGLGTP